MLAQGSADEQVPLSLPLFEIKVWLLKACAVRVDASANAAHDNTLVVIRCICIFLNSPWMAVPITRVSIETAPRRAKSAGYFSYAERRKTLANRLIGARQIFRTH